MEEMGWFRDHLKLHLMIKSSHPILAGMQYSHLRCLRIRLEEGTVIKMPKKYIQKMKKEMCMEECAKMATPVVNDTTIDETDKLDYDMKKIYGT
eukprot:11613715-Heterocapsa_arctica.AAC.1